MLLKDIKNSIQNSIRYKKNFISSDSEKTPLPKVLESDFNKRNKVAIIILIIGLILCILVKNIFMLLFPGIIALVLLLLNFYLKAQIERTGYDVIEGVVSEQRTFIPKIRKNNFVADTLYVNCFLDQPSERFKDYGGLTIEIPVRNRKHPPEVGSAIRTYVAKDVHYLPDLKNDTIKFYSILAYERLRKLDN